MKPTLLDYFLTKFMHREDSRIASEPRLFAKLMASYSDDSPKSVEEIASSHYTICAYARQALQEDNKKTNRSGNQRHGLHPLFRSLVIDLVWAEREALLVRTDTSNDLHIGSSESISVESESQSEGRA